MGACIHCISGVYFNIVIINYLCINTLAYSPKCQIMCNKLTFGVCLFAISNLMKTQK